MATAGVYKITNPFGKCYIGQSSNIERRIIEHKYNGKNKKIKLSNSISNYGIDNHKIDIPFISENKYERERMESIYIRLLDSINNGLNHIDIISNIGSFSGKKHTKENVDKIKQRMNGVKPQWAIDKVKKSIYCEYNNKTYGSLIECAKDLNISQPLASMQYNGKRPNKYGLR